MRHRILAVAALLAFSSVHAQDKVLRVVPHSNLSILDPIWTTQFMARNHGYMIYDTLFGTDEKNQVKPQMVDKWTVSPDQRLWTFTLRPGLEFHDGKPVTGDDVTASLERWGKRDAMGRRSRRSLSQTRASRRTSIARCASRKTGGASGSRASAISSPSCRRGIAPAPVDTAWTTCRAHWRN